MPKGYRAEFDFTGNRSRDFFSKYKDIEADYLTADIWSEGGIEDDRYALLNAIRELSLPERRILLTYAECGTYAETARVFNVNAKTVKNYIVKLKNKLIEKI